MQTFLKHNKLLSTLSLTLFIITIPIIIHKLDFIPQFHILNSLLPLYAIFFSTICAIIFILYKSKLQNRIYTFFALTSPTIFLMIIGLNLTNSLHYIFYIFVGFWIISFGLYFIKRLNLSRNIILPQQKEKSQKLYTPWIFITLFIIIIIHICFGLYNINRSSYVDEKLWTYGTESRIEKYYPNILERDWKNTRPSDKPGVTLAAISGIGLIWTTPSDFYHNFDDAEKLMNMLATMRIPILLFTSLMLFIFYHIIAKLFNWQIGLFTTSLLALSPIILGISRLINPDALSWVFMPLTLLLYFLYIKTKNYNWLYLTGIFLGLSLLTKYVANLLIVFFVIEIFIEAILLKKHDNLQDFLRNKIIDIFIVIFIALSTFYILFPGVWLKPDRLLLGTLWSQAFLPIWKPFIIFCSLLLLDNFLLKSKIFIFITTFLQKISKLLYLVIPIIFLVSILIVLINAYIPTTFIDFETLVAAPKGNDAFSIFEIFLSGFYSATFSISPIVFTGLILGVATLFFKKSKNFFCFVIWNLLLFIIIYYLGSTISLVASTVRYQIILYPLFFTISAFGWYSLIIYFKKPTLFAILIFITIITSCYTLFTIKPHYFVYTSSFLPQKYIVNPKDMGDGSYEAGMYLNSLPNSKELKIWSDRNGVCVVFNGYCNHSPHLDIFSENGTNYDYYVVSKASEYKIKYLTEQRLSNVPTYNLRLDKLYNSTNFIFNLHPANRLASYVRIIPGDSIIVLESNK